MSAAVGQPPPSALYSVTMDTACWRRVTDERLRALSERYGADYAVLYRGTPTALPVLYEDDGFALVSLRPPS